MNLAIFDIDGTLTNTNSVDNECFVKALAETHAVTEIDTDWAAYPHTTDSGIILHIFRQKFGRQPAEKELDAFKCHFVNNLSEQYQHNSSGFAQIAGASLALGRLKRESDWAVAIATGCWRDSALLKLKAAEIDISGIPAAFAEDGLSREEILQEALSQSLEMYRVSGFGKIVSIGDGLWDVRTARNLEFSFLGIGCGDREIRLRRAGATHIIKNFADYGQFLRCLTEAGVPKTEDVL